LRLRRTVPLYIQVTRKGKEDASYSGHWERRKRGGEGKKKKKEVGYRGTIPPSAHPVRSFWRKRGERKVGENILDGGSNLMLNNNKRMIIK